MSARYVITYFILYKMEPFNALILVSEFAPFNVIIVKFLLTYCDNLLQNFVQ